jgi:hypothetical protein
VPAPDFSEEVRLMNSRVARRIATTTVPLALVFGVLSCNKSATLPSPVLVTEVFNGTLQPLGTDFKTFTINYTQSSTDLSVTVNSLSTVANMTPLTVTIGIGFGVVSGNACQVQISNSTATVGQELFAPSGASAGTYCVEIFDVNTLSEATNYQMTVKHY